MQEDSAAKEPTTSSRPVRGHVRLHLETAGEFLKRNQRVIHPGGVFGCSIEISRDIIAGIFLGENFSRLIGFDLK